MSFQELKERQSVVWGNAPFENVSATGPDIYDGVVEALAPRPGEQWLDVACGTGALAERAAQAGADVTGIDFAPALIATAKRSAAEQGLEIDFRVGDAEELDVEDARFDVVTSTFGVMFAPDHPRAAGELARVARAGGRLGLTTWTPDGGIGQMFKFTTQYQPAPPPGAGIPLEWGRREYVEELLDDAFDLRFEERNSPLVMDSAEDYWQFFITNFGPMKTLTESMDDDRREEFHRAWVDFMESNWSKDGHIEHERQYLLVTGTRR
jgi:ubiquinone/menaquinone biosynthesis C-methylase UbiE